MAVIHDGNGNAISTDNPLAVRTEGGGTIQPVDIQSRYGSFSQQINAVSVATLAVTRGSFVACDTFDEVSILGTASVSTNNGQVSFEWSADGINGLMSENSTLGTSTSFTATTKVKAPFVRAVVYNNSAGAVTMSAWIYLKA